MRERAERVYLNLMYMFNMWQCLRCVMCVWCVTQVVPGAELDVVAWDDPEQAEDADAVEGGVAAGTAWASGAQHSCTAALQGEGLQAGQEAACKGPSHSVTELRIEHSPGTLFEHSNWTLYLNTLIEHTKFTQHFSNMTNRSLTQPYTNQCTPL